MGGKAQPPIINGIHKILAILMSLIIAHVNAKQVQQMDEYIQEIKI